MLFPLIRWRFQTFTDKPDRHMKLLDLLSRNSLLGVSADYVSTTIVHDNKVP